jgi:hypothetical protein
MQKYIAVVNPKMDEDDITRLIRKGIAGALFEISHQNYPLAMHLIELIQRLSQKWRDRIVVECACLESKYIRKGIEGSNPSLSAKEFFQPDSVSTPLFGKIINSCGKKWYVSFWGQVYGPHE